MIPLVPDRWELAWEKEKASQRDAEYKSANGVLFNQSVHYGYLNKERDRRLKQDGGRISTSIYWG